MTRGITRSHLGVLSLSSTCPAALLCTSSSEGVGRVTQRQGCSSCLQAWASSRPAVHEVGRRAFNIFRATSTEAGMRSRGGGA